MGHSSTDRQGSFDISVSSIAELASVHVAELTDGAVAYVQSTKAYWVLDKTSGLTADDVTVVSPLAGSSAIAGEPRARWVIPAASGGSLTGGFASFFALMPGDNAGTVAAGAAVLFPQDGPSSAGTAIVRTSSSQFNLPNIGTYEVSWQVSVTEAGQLMLGVDSGGGVVEQAPTVAGRATGTSQIMNTVFIKTTVVNSILTVRNPSGNSTALTITPSAGGTHAVSAWLTVKQVA